MVVEVVERTELAYFKADVLDVDGSNALIRYIGETETLFADISRIRTLPPELSSQDIAKFNPQIGDRVEVEFVDEHGPTSWWDGKIENMKKGHYVVRFPDGDQAIVEKEKLRPSYGHAPVRIAKKIIPVPTDKQETFLNINHEHHLDVISKHVS
jgi:hypothetical protein